MNQENNNFKFNVDILMNDVNNVIQTGINNLLKDFTTNYKLYEETHNCIMNLPSVKREIYKRNYTDVIDENYDDLPDLISMSSDDDSSKYDRVNYTRIPIQDDSDEESDDTFLCMKKVANQLLKEKEETIALYQKEKISYNEIIEKCYKEIEYLKHEIYELKKSINQPVVCDLTSEELIVEIKQEKENIILHIEENPDQSDELDEDEEDNDEEVDDEEAEDNDEEEEDDYEEVEEDNEEEAEDEIVEDNKELDDDEEVEEDNEEVVEEDDEEVDDDEVVEEDDEEEVVEEDNEEVDDDEVVEEENDDVETENSGSDEKSQEELDENEEEELIEIEIDDVTYCTNNEDNGFIYELDKDGNVGEVIGYLKDGEPFFN
jgi:hypothetical protein